MAFASLSTRPQNFKLNAFYTWCELETLKNILWPKMMPYLTIHHISRKKMYKESWSNFNKSNTHTHPATDWHIQSYKPWHVGILFCAKIAKPRGCHATKWPHFVSKWPTLVKTRTVNVSSDHSLMLCAGHRIGFVENTTTICCVLVFSISVSHPFNFFLTKSATSGGLVNMKSYWYLYTRKDDRPLGHALDMLDTVSQSIPCFPNMWRYNFWAWSRWPAHIGWLTWTTKQQPHVSSRLSSGNFCPNQRLFQRRTMPMLRIICPIKYINFNSERSKPGMLPSGHGKWAPVQSLLWISDQVLEWACLFEAQCHRNEWKFSGTTVLRGEKWHT